MNKHYYQNFIQAGQIASQVRSFGKSLIRPGARYNEIIEQVRGKIIELGAIPAFPPQIALNDVAAHYLPQPGQEIVLSNEVVKLDVGICYQGAIGDCACTVDLSGQYRSLVEAAEAALLAAEQVVAVGTPLYRIGQAIESTIQSYGFIPVRNLSGHGLGLYQVHTDPSIPNYDNRSKQVIKPGMTIAIEPFATNGTGLIFETGEPTIFSLVKSRPVRNPTTQHVLAKIESFKGLPFATHDLLDPFHLLDVKIALMELMQAQIIIGYPPLAEKGHGMVAQAENSVLIDPKGNVTVTTRS